MSMALAKRRGPRLPRKVPAKLSGDPKSAMPGDATDRRAVLTAPTLETPTAGTPSPPPPRPAGRDALRVLGIDPGLRNTGWGVIDVTGSRIAFVAAGTLHPPTDLSLPMRLASLHAMLTQVLDAHAPHEAAVEETFVNANPRSTLKLGQARGVAILVPALAGLPVGEYAPNLVKKTVVGVGHAAKEQIGLMVRTLLPRARFDSEDAADALAVALCHAHQRQAARVLA